MIVAGGADNNIRVWRFVSHEKPEINPMVVARFAHEGAIIRLAFSRDGTKLISLAEDRTIKVWRTSDYTELKLWENQPDVPTALALGPDGVSFEVGRMDGSLAGYAIPASEPLESESRAVVARAKSVAMPEIGPIDETREQEPNNGPGQANALKLPARVIGAIDGTAAGLSDSDFFRFTASAGQEWVFEIIASRSGSKLDSFVEILDSQGRRVPRVLLQAVRDSYFTFRGKNDSETDDFRLFNWAEMHLNEYLYAGGEVVKFWLYPRGPILALSPIRARANVGAISIRPRWRMRWASRAMLWRLIRRDPRLSPTGCPSSWSTMKTTTMPTESWARTRACISLRRRMATTCSSSRTCTGSRGRIPLHALGPGVPP